VRSKERRLCRGSRGEKNGAYPRFEQPGGKTDHDVQPDAAKDRVDEDGLFPGKAPSCPRAELFIPGADNSAREVMKRGPKRNALRKTAHGVETVAGKN